MTKGKNSANAGHSKYDASLTCALPFNGINEKVPLCKELKKEGCDVCVSTAEIVIDMDQVKNNHKSGYARQPKSVDFLFVRSDKKIVLTECRYNYNKLQNLRRGELEEKVKQSKDEIISKGLTDPCHNKTILLFSNNMAHQAITRIAGLYSSKGKASIPFEVMTTAQFLDRFF